MFDFFNLNYHKKCKLQLLTQGCHICHNKVKDEKHERIVLQFDEAKLVNCNQVLGHVADHNYVAKFHMICICTFALKNINAFQPTLLVPDKTEVLH